MKSNIEYYMQSWHIILCHIDISVVILANHIFNLKDDSYVTPTVV